jgi:hypothetical protein
MGWLGIQEGMLDGRLGSAVEGMRILTQRTRGGRGGNGVRTAGEDRARAAKVKGTGLKTRRYNDWIRYKGER